MSSSETGLQGHQKTTSLNDCIPSWKGCCGSRHRHANENFAQIVTLIAQKLPWLWIYFAASDAGEQARWAHPACYIWGGVQGSGVRQTALWGDTGGALRSFLCKSSVKSGQLFAHFAAWALHLLASMLARGKYSALEWDKQLQVSGEKHIFQEFLLRWNTWNFYFFFSLWRASSVLPSGWAILQWVTPSKWVIAWNLEQRLGKSFCV